MMLDKKKIQVIFLFEFKMDREAAEITHNINKAFDPGTANEHTVRWWLKKFCKGDESFEDEECSGWPWEVDYNQLRAIIESDPLTTAGEVARELSVDHSTVFQHLKQTGKVQNLDKWELHELTTTTKILHFEDRSVTCKEKWIVYNNQ
ncbi:hypothetical protein FD755_007561 [Muntiacus reevesi]|uniref:Mos1 transposase HTH domain-containing protein n=1 Tax=Muntiacus reevesi TaxID=9886 RepID=A0A5J5MJN0_MUNRE|nr:hypothetical protein FD755_007561 [Muntiacus reevesi]